MYRFFQSVSSGDYLRMTVSVAGAGVLHRLRNVLLIPSAGAGVSKTTCTRSVMLRKAFRESLGSIYTRFFRSIPSGACLRMTDSVTLNLIQHLYYPIVLPETMFFIVSGTFY